jgi:hypothetical protein
MAGTPQTKPAKFAAADFRIKRIAKAHIKQEPTATVIQAPVPERPIALPPENQGATHHATAIPTTTAAVR